MSISFFEPGAVPRPREDVKIEKLQATVLEDRWRIRIDLHVTPFLERPNLAVALLSDHIGVVSEMSIIETMHSTMEFTMHVRGLEDPQGEYLLKARLYYDQDIQNAYDQREIQVVVAPPVEPG